MSKNKRFELQKYDLQKNLSTNSEQLLLVILLKIA